jgi:hypothetical protein
MPQTTPRPIVQYGHGKRLTEAEIRSAVRKAIESGMVAARRVDRLIVGMMDLIPERSIRNEWRKFVKELGICRVHLGSIRPGRTVVDEIALSELTAVLTKQQGTQEVHHAAS